MAELSTYDHAETLVELADHIAAMIRGARLDVRVPTCPDWDLRQLVTHVGRAPRWGADIVRRRAAGPGEAGDSAAIEVPDADEELGEWLSAGARELVDEVGSVGADERVWNYLGVHEVAGFWLRRMANEILVHQVDVALTIGAPYRLDPHRGADAVSEWLSIIGSPGAAAYRPELAEQLRGHGQTLHLHATDTAGLGESGEWLIRRGPEGMSWEHGHTKAEVAVRGLAGDLLLALLGRIPLGDQRLDIIGDTDLFEHWVRHVTF